MWYPTLVLNQDPGDFNRTKYVPNRIWVKTAASRRLEYAVEMEKWRRKTALAKKKRQEQKESNRIARMQREASPSYDGRPGESGVISTSSNLSSSASKIMPEHPHHVTPPKNFFQSDLIWRCHQAQLKPFLHSLVPAIGP